MAAADQEEHPGWQFFRDTLQGAKYHVAPMVDQSELAFRQLCRRYGATCAYTPMLHARRVEWQWPGTPCRNPPSTAHLPGRLFVENEAYREEHFTTCAQDRPLLVQFCANEPDTLLAAAKLVEGRCDGVDINFGCPQRIARRGNYGACLMDDLQRVEALVSKLAQNLSVPVTCKIRIFPDLERTVQYARMIEAAGCSLLAVHGRTRDQKDSSKHRADWAAIAAVRAALRIPVLANGDVRDLNEAHACMEATGCVGVLSAEPLLRNPALFDATAPPDAATASEWRPAEWPAALAVEYCDAAAAHSPTPLRMVRGHVHKLLGPWLAEFTDLREALNNTHRADADGGLMTLADVRAICLDARARIQHIHATEGGRRAPIPKLSERALKREEEERAKQAAIEAQQHEEQGEQGPPKRARLPSDAGCDAECFVGA